VSNDQSQQIAALERLEPFIGEWGVEAVFPQIGPTGMGGRSVFEWTLDGKFLVQRSSVDHPEAPDGLEIVAVNPDGETYTQHYFDSRGVVRVYAMTFADGVWTLERREPDFSPLDFQQRFRGEFSADGDRIEGAWETSDDGSDWKLDFELIYTRL
jgi:hypothetical protein